MIPICLKDVAILIKKKKFVCEDKNCRCKSKETGICEICY